MKRAYYCIGRGKDQRKQRGKRGFADHDVYSLDYYLAGLLGDAIEEFLASDPADWFGKREEVHRELTEAQAAFKAYAKQCPADDETVPGISLALRILAKHWTGLWT